MFGTRIDIAIRYADLLADTGVSHGLLGPREVPRIWDRHLLNCAVLQELVPPDATVADVGSGAGLPGLVLAIARPDCTVILIEPLQRRVTWLDQTIRQLAVDNVRVVRGRAQHVVDVRADVVTSRAVARLDQLLGWSLPLVRPGGLVLAIKGSSAADELTDARGVLRSARAGSAEVLQVGAEVIDPPTTVVRVVNGDGGSQ